MPRELSGLYVITDEFLTPDSIVVEQVRKAIEAGAGIVQYRNKTKPDAEVRTVCMELQALCREKKSVFIIDDRPELASEIGADGLHIGKDDMPLSEARTIFPEGIVGVSCYGSIRKAKEAEEEGADYAAFGSFYPSPTKPHSGIVSKSVIAKAKDALDIPVCVIGGINLLNIHEVASLRPDMISVVSAAFDGDIVQNVRHLLQGMRV